MVKVSGWLVGSVVRSPCLPRVAGPPAGAAASVRTVYFGLAGLLAGLLSGCVEVPVTNQINPPPPGVDGGIDQGADLGQNAAPAWKWESPQPQGNNLRALWGVPGRTADQDQVYAGGDSGALMIGGTAGWQQQRGGVVDQRAILAIAGQAGSTTPLAVGTFDLALQRTGGGWTDKNPLLGTGEGSLTAAWATTTAGEYFVVGTTGRIYHVQLGGSTWAREGSGVATESLFGLAGSGTGTAMELYAVGDSGRVIHRLGGTWTVEANNMVTSQLNSVWIGDGPTAGQVYAVGNGATFLHKQAGTWSIEKPPTTAQLNAVWGSGDDVYVVGSGGTILHRKAGNWQPEAVGLTGELLTALWGTVRGGQITLYAAGNFGTLLRLDGGTWQSLSSRVTASPLNRVWARNPGEVYAIGSDGLILRRSGTAAQGSWTTVASGVTTAALNALTGWSASPTAGEAEVWAVGTTGAIVHKSGTTWSVDGGFLTTQELTGVWAGQDSVYVVGRGGRIYHKLQGTWTIELGPGGMPVTNDLGAVWGTGSGAAEVVYVVGDKGLVLRRTMLGWAQEAPTLTQETLVALFGTNEDNLYALGNKGGTFRRLAGTWQPTTIGQLGPGAAGVAGCVIPGSQDLLAVGDQGTITRRTVSGWLAEPALTLMPYSGVAAAAVNDYYIVGSNGLILHKY
jgi:hypothetical protein